MRLTEAIEELHAAEGADAQLAAIATYEYAKQTKGACIPSKEIPTCALMAPWLPDCPERAWIASWERMPEFEAPNGVRYRTGSSQLHAIAMSAALNWSWRVGQGPWRGPSEAGRPRIQWDVTADNLSEVVQETHSMWLATPEQQRGPHPIGPLVRAWQERPVAVAPFRPKRRAALPKLQRLEQAGPRLRNMPGFYGETAPRQSQLTLPGLALEPRLQCASGLLSLYDGCGGPLNTQGRGAPWALRLFIGAMLHLPVEQRDGYWRTLRFPLAEVEAWLHPGGWDRSNRHKYWHRLPEALHAMARDMGWLPVPGVGLVRIVQPSVIPQSPDAPGVEFTIRIPTQAARGDRIDWPKLCEYGKHSAALYRAYLSACAIMGQSARKGQPLTRLIAAPVPSNGSRPARRKDGKILRDPAAVVPNPAARYALGLTERELAQVIGFDPQVRQYRAKARAAFEQLHADGVIELARDGERWRIFGPDGRPAEDSVVMR